MRIFAALLILLLDFSYGRSFAAIRKDAFAVGVSRADSASEYDFIAEITAKMKIQRFRLVLFDNAPDGEKLLLSGKIDAIISKINYSPHLESKFLLSKPYCKTEIALAVAANNSSIWTLNDLSKKNIAFMPKEISSEQILAIWPSANLVAARTLNEALHAMNQGEAQGLAANRQTLTTQSAALRIFPNKLAENNIVALFAPDSKNLQEEFDKAVDVIDNGELRIENGKMQNLKSGTSVNRGYRGSDEKDKNRINKIQILLDELQKEVKELNKELNKEPK